MTDKRNPTERKYKQIYYKNNRSQPYTSATLGLDDYLMTDVWLKLRNERLNIDFHRCVRCGTAFNVQVHHLKYPEIWGEEDVERDLVTLCATCHAETHKIDMREGK